MVRIIVVAALASVLSGCIGEAQHEINGNTDLTSTSTEPEVLAQAVKDIMTARCTQCHDSSLGAGDILNIDNLDHIVNSGLVIPGEPVISKLFHSVDTNSMPPTGPLNLSEKNTIYNWILFGAPTSTEAPTDDGTSTGNTTITGAFTITSFALNNIVNVISTDIGKISTASRPFIRYFVYPNPTSIGSDERLGINKLINSLSSKVSITNPRVIDATGYLFRVNISLYGWSAEEWTAIEQQYALEYLDSGIPGTASSTTTTKINNIKNHTKSTLPFIRADWFMKRASEPTLYYRLLKIPNTVQELEAQLGIDPIANINAGLVDRIGTTYSGVSAYNRVYERHNTAWGSYWKSYDFASNEGTHNILERPLGPDGQVSATTNFPGFVPDGGEYIWHLPNGLQAYMISTGVGTRLNTAPTAIVQDPLRDDRTVTNAISCFACHAQGVNRNYDDVLPLAESLFSPFSLDQVFEIRSIYRTDSIINTRYNQSDAIYQNALRKTGITDYTKDPIIRVYKKY